MGLSRLSTDYVMLMTSLPHLGDLFTMTTPPISRIQLDKRLSLLNDLDSALLLSIENLLQWDHLVDVLGESGQDEMLIQAADRLIEQLSPAKELKTLLDVVRYRLDLRSIVAALRYRAKGINLQDSKGRWSYGKFNEHIRRHWDQPTFQLDQRFSWIKSVHKSMLQGSTYDVERELLSISWNSISLAQNYHQFDFVAVALYTLKWNIATRWMTYDHEGASERFNQLLKSSTALYFDRSVHQGRGIKNGK